MHNWHHNHLFSFVLSILWMFGGVVKIPPRIRFSKGVHGMETCFGSIFKRSIGLSYIFKSLFEVWFHHPKIVVSSPYSFAIHGTRAGWTIFNPLGKLPLNGNRLFRDFHLIWIGIMSEALHRMSATSIWFLIAFFSPLPLSFGRWWRRQRCSLWVMWEPCYC